LQFSGLPVRVSIVQALPSPQSTGQFPSQVSELSTVPLPHVAEHSLSLLLSQPTGQQPSPVTHWEIDWWLHAALQEVAPPVNVSTVHELPSLQSAGQLPSHVSPGSTTRLPQLAEQSLSELLLQPAGQQPSASVHWETDWWLQAALQFAALPVGASTVQAFPSLQSVGQLPSQVSPVSTTPLPQLAEQSESLLLVHPAGQQPSPPTHWVTGWCVHAALHVEALPVITSWVHAFPSLQSLGQLPSQVSLGSTTPLPQVAEQSESVPEVHPAGQQPSPPSH